MTTLGELVRWTRLRAGISQRSLARRAGTTQASISRIEAGLEEPGYARFKAIMNSLGYEPELQLRRIAEHRAEPRRLLEERWRTPDERVAEGIAGARLAKKLAEARRG